PGQIADPGRDPVADRAGALGDAGQAVELHLQQRTLELVHAQVLAQERIAVDLLRSRGLERVLAALVLVLGGAALEARVVGDERPALAGGDVLGQLEAEGADPTVAPD